MKLSSEWRRTISFFRISVLGFDFINNFFLRDETKIDGPVQILAERTAGSAVTPSRLNLEPGEFLGFQRQLGNHWRGRISFRLKEPSKVTTNFQWEPDPHDFPGGLTVHHISDQRNGQEIVNASIPGLKEGALEIYIGPKTAGVIRIG